MLSVVVYQWREPQIIAGREYLPEHVNTLQRAVARVLPIPHRFICVADEPDGFAPAVEVIETPAEARDVGRYRNPMGTRFPSCYRRLWGFSLKAAQLLGEWTMVMDIDLVPTDDWRPLIRFDHDFIGTRPHMLWGQPIRVAGGLYLMRTGAHTEVWTRFVEDPERAIGEAKRAGYFGSDQAWISYCLCPGAATWPEPSGIYSIRDIRNGKLPLPADARLVQFNGSKKPWQSELAWVREHWR